MAIFSAAEIRNRKTVPEVYDLHYVDYRTFSEHHTYSIEIRIAADGY